MSARAIAIVVMALTAPAAAESDTAVSATSLADEIGDQGMGASVGVAGGTNFSPGGLRVAGHYLYQLSETDWFDGTASFTYGGRSAGCSPDQMSSALACDHGVGDGASVEIAATVRRMFAAQGAFRPFARAGLGVAVVRYAGDDLSGIAFPIHLGGGVRTAISPSVAVVAQADLSLGVGAFGRGLGLEPQVGMTVTAGAEFRLR